jgi:lipopolysaccharide transport system permease protein
VGPSDCSPNGRRRLALACAAAPDRDPRHHQGLLRPAIGIFGMALLFGKVLNAPSQGLPYLIFVLFGAHAWIAFERPAFWAVRSFDVYRRLARNLYMPLILVPLSAVLPALIEGCVIGVFAAGVLVYFSIADGTLYLQVGPEMIVALAGYVLATTLAVSLGLWMSVLNAYARDVRIIFIYVLRIWMFITPVIYPVTTLPGAWQTIAHYNPASAPVLMVKWGLLGVGSVPLHSILITIGTIVVVGLGGVCFFARQAPTLLDRQPPDLDDEDEMI